MIQAIMDWFNHNKDNILGLFFVSNAASTEFKHWNELKTAFEHHFSQFAIICGSPRIYQPTELKISVPNLHPKKFLMKSVQQILKLLSF